MTQVKEKLLYHERIENRPLFIERYEKHKDTLALARTDYGLTPTAYLVEALEYHHRAQILQDRNLGLLAADTVCGDLLQDNVTIYDTVNRRYAGFSNVLEQLWYGEWAPKYFKTQRLLAERGFTTKAVGKDMSLKEWYYICLVHRVTGSGASFMADHGWRNTIVPYMAQSMHECGLKQALKTLRDWYAVGPIFTSLGNQIPSFNKPSSDKWRTGGIEYLHDLAPRLVSHMVDWLEARLRRTGVACPIQEAVEETLNWQVSQGWRRFKFVLTAWIMDIAEYSPHLVDPNSDCFHGKNAIETMSLIFDRSQSKPKGQAFFDKATRFVADWSNTKPMDVEDAAAGCDAVRYFENFIPKKNYEHLDLDVIYNSSSIKHPYGRQK